MCKTLSELSQILSKMHVGLRSESTYRELKVSGRSIRVTTKPYKERVF